MGFVTIEVEFGASLLTFHCRPYDYRRSCECDVQILPLIRLLHSFDLAVVVIVCNARSGSPDRNETEDKETQCKENQHESKFR